ncbi:MAG: orotate phosphoribosyltransferase [Burkholderiales bacterium]|nr:orotate phosphoribosyltransferase [Burkholderiales bacterium]
MSSDFRDQFIRFAIAQKVLCFGEFKTKAGRLSPYFFNAGLFNDGASLAMLGQFYAKAIEAAALRFDMLFGPAYKGIPLVSTVAIALAQMGVNLPYAYNRKETKDHGEGGMVVGAPLRGRVLIVDDVISAGESVRESVQLIRSHNGEPAGVVIALDRMERGTGEGSAADEVQANVGIPVISIATLDDLESHLSLGALDSNVHERVARYRAAYGVGGKPGRS